ncbi:DEAD/DEAH box helicase [Stutzerimonas frequens]|uniref:DEAD/DEAH box helicase n=1 Tax=Stutzerimonas frequens TaxID=2968969 RepID=UPI0037479E4E
MELNAYQSQVIADLELYLRRWCTCGDAQLAYRAHWDAQGAPKMPGYQAAPHGAPQVCAKVPTAGGKTFIGLHALASIFTALERRQGDARLCLWLVPSLSILDQVLHALRNPEHPYRLTLNRLFEGRVSVLDKRELLAGQFSRDEVEDGLVLAVLTYDSLKARNKDDRKLYQENSALDDLASSALAVAEGIDPHSLVAAMAGLNPVVIVDESHNVTSALSLDMLRNLNPAFVFELTATPRAGANIISFVDAMALRDQHMVKLPVIVRNLPDRDSVIGNAIDLRTRLEAEAQAEREQGGAHIRPIVLIQAESRIKSDAQTFEQVKAELLARGIAEEWVKIKTAERDELRGLDLLAADCPVRFIITVNALKEGWDCPFAYILATLADRSSAVDVEQILGRILRQPYVRAHGQEPLNMSYVLTSSSVFSQTLEKIVVGLNRAGFSRHDFRTPDLPAGGECGTAGGVGMTPDSANAAQANGGAPIENLPLFAIGHDQQVSVTAVGNASQPLPLHVAEPATASMGEVDMTLQAALAAQAELAAASAAAQGRPIPTEVRNAMDLYPLRPKFAEEVRSLRLPQFFRVAPANSFFADESGGVLLEKENLLDSEFRLVDCDVNDFALAPAGGDLVKLDLLRVGEVPGDYEPTRIQLKTAEISKWRDYLSSLNPEARRRQLSGLMAKWLGSMPPLVERDLQAYSQKILARLSPAQLDAVLEQQQSYVDTIRQRVRREMLDYSRRRFRQWIDLRKVDTRPSYRLPEEIAPRQKAPVAADNSLYLREERGNGLEERMAEFLADCENLRWWHRNPSGRGFCLNGPINHYPDFILRLRSGMIVLLETKGGDRDNSDSAAKIELGRLWEQCAGRDYRYLMVFENNPPTGAYAWADACELLRRL